MEKSRFFNITLRHPEIIKLLKILDSGNFSYNKETDSWCNKTSIQIKNKYVQLYNFTIIQNLVELIKEKKNYKFFRS